MSEHKQSSVLDTRIQRPDWFGIAGIGIVLVAAFVRLFRLDTYLLNAREANWAYDAFSLFYGRPLPAGQSLPESGPFMLIWNALTFFLFGVTDATARIGSVVLGLGLIAIVFLLRPVLSRAQILAIAGIIAISPTVVFASRTIEPGIAAAFFAMLLIVATVRIGHSTETPRGWAVLLGFALAALYATGPLGVTTILALGVAISLATVADLASKSASGAIGNAIKNLGQNPTAILWAFGGLIVTLLVLFTRMFSSLSALSGLSTTMVDWLGMMSSGVSTIPAVFYFWSLMLYETIAVIIALLTALLARRRDLRSDAPTSQITPLLYVIWFAVALLLHTLASTRDTGSAVLVVLPVLLLAGTGLGRFVELSVDKMNHRVVTATLVTALLVVYSGSAMVGLSFTRGETGVEPLAHDTPSADTRSFLDQVMRLSRDISVEDYSYADPTGQFGLTIQVTPQYEWPFTWYFRDFPNFSVAPAGSVNEMTDIAIAPNDEVMESVGLSTFELNWMERPGDSLTMMDSAEILRTGLRPSNWGDAWRFMIHREADRYSSSRHMVVGYGPRIMEKLTTTTEPVNLFDDNLPGPQIGPGQLNHPGAIAIDSEGRIYIANALNNRIEVFDDDGVFLESWSPERDPLLQLGWNNSQGASSMVFGPDGRLYIADTWNHVVLVVSQTGTVEAVIGERGRQVDITDEGDPNSLTGQFFGPRGVAVTDKRIYVTDTGNERVQIFDLEGSLVGVFGGYGVEDGRFVEPTGVAIDSRGRVWIADSGNARLQEFDAEGQWLASHHIPSWENQFGIERFNMIAFDSEDVLYFTTPGMGVWAWSTESPAVPLDSDMMENSPFGDALMSYPDLRPGDIAIDDTDRVLVTRIHANTVDALIPSLPDSFIAPAATPQATPSG